MAEKVKPAKKSMHLKYSYHTSLNIDVSRNPLKVPELESVGKSHSKANVTSENQTLGLHLTFKMLRIVKRGLMF